MLLKKHFENYDYSYPCPACDTKVNSGSYVYIQEVKEYYIYRCNFCGLMLLRPVLLPKLKGRQMDSVDDAEFFNNSLLKKLHKKLILEREISTIKSLNTAKKQLSLLDVGCGSGWIANIWSEHGFSVTGLEPSKARRKHALEKYGLNTIPGFLEDFESDTKFDLIILRHVVEHFENPRKMLLKSVSLLNPGGLILVVVPNANCIGRYIFDAKWSWILPYHCNFFNPKSLRTIFEKAGFEIKKIYQTPSPLWYPESFLRLFPGSHNISAHLYKKLSLAALIPFSPLVLFGYISGLSENITVIAKAP